MINFKNLSKKHQTVSIIFFSGFLLSLFAFLLIKNLYIQRVKSDFSKVSMEYTLALTNAFNSSWVNFNSLPLAAESALRNIPVQGVDFYISLRGQKKPLYFHASRTHKKTVIRPSKNKFQLNYRAFIVVKNVQLSVHFFPAPFFFSQYRLWLLPFVLLWGIIITGLVGFTAAKILSGEEQLRLVVEKKGEEIHALTKTISLEMDEKKHIIEALQYQTGETQNIFDWSPLMIYYKDNQNRYLKVNKKFLIFSGLSREQIEGKSEQEINVLSGMLAKELEQAVIASGQPSETKGRVIKTSQGDLFYDLTIIPYYDNDGKIIGTINFLARSEIT